MMFRRIGSLLSLLLLIACSGCDSSESLIESSSSDLAAESNEPITPAPVTEDRTLRGSNADADLGRSEPNVNLPESGRAERLNDRAGGAVESPAVALPGPEPLNRSFDTMQAIESDDPSELVRHLRKIDVAIGDLVLAGSNNNLDKQRFIDSGIRLGKMKHAAGERLAGLPSADAEQKKAGVLAQLVALSHMSGIGDVEAAKQLESFARDLSDATDPDLAHQSQVVLLGFELQALQNGAQSDPKNLMSHVGRLFERIESRDFPELMMLQQAYYVLRQMGFDESSEEVSKIIISEYMDSADPQLRAEAWSFATRDSQALANFNMAHRGLGTEQFDSSSFVAAARGLFKAFPNATALEHLANSVSNVEYGGAVKLSNQLASFVEDKVKQFPDSVSAEIAHQMLADHDARITLLGKPIKLTQIMAFDGADIDWSKYQGKTILIDFWATWCEPCLLEIPNIRRVHAEYLDQGFEVIGVNMDDDLEKAREFVGKQNFPWRNFYFQDQLGFGSAFAKQTGLTMIPFIVLVGPDGNVAKIHARGGQIGPSVRSLLGPDGSDASLIPDLEVSNN